MTKILLVEEYNLVRAGIKRLLLDHEMIAAVDESVGSIDALEKIRTKQHDIVVMNLGSDFLSVFDVTRRMLANHSQVKIIVLTNQINTPFASRILRAGAVACLGKRSSINDLFSAIKAARAGKRYVSTDIVQSTVLRRNAFPFMNLSNRELQIMFMFVNGQKVKSIADKLFLSPKTVSTYRYRIFNKLDVRGDVEMTHMALRSGVFAGAKMTMTQFCQAS